MGVSTLAVAAVAAATELVALALTSLIGENIEEIGCVVADVNVVIVAIVAIVVGGGIGGAIVPSIATTGKIVGRFVWFVPFTLYCWVLLLPTSWHILGQPQIVVPLKVIPPHGAIPTMLVPMVENVPPLMSTLPLVLLECAI